MPGPQAALPVENGSASGEIMTTLRDAGEPSLSVRRVPGPGSSVIYVHGSSFPSALSINYAIDGISWADHLQAKGFDVWSFDFPGYGGSERWSPTVSPGEGSGDIPGRGAEAVRHVERVVRHILEQTGSERVSIIAHSWGAIPASLFTGRSPELVDRLVLFGPVCRRDGGAQGSASPFLLVTADDQWRNFRSGVPDGYGPPIAKERFDQWASTYLKSDAASATRSPPSVEVPAGPAVDIAEAWSGRLAYDPALIRSPTLIVRGEWDSVTTDADAEWLARAMTGVPGGAHDCKLAAGAHRMHLEDNRVALFDSVADFLLEGSR